MVPCATEASNREKDKDKRGKRSNSAAELAKTKLQDQLQSNVDDILSQKY